MIKCYTKRHFTLLTVLLWQWEGIQSVKICSAYLYSKVLSVETGSARSNFGEESQSENKDDDKSKLKVITVVAEDRHENRTDDVC